MFKYYIITFLLLISSFIKGTQRCDEGYSEINGLCFFDNDISILQKFIDNSYVSGIDLGCEDWDDYCGSPNPYMDSSDSWFWVEVDGMGYEWPGNNNGMVEPLELGIQEWENGRLINLMCGAYIYCQLSGPIPEEINQLTELQQLRLEYNYLSGQIPETICEIETDHSDYLAFDLSGNLLCPPYPECIDTSGFFYQDTSDCFDLGDINFDGEINVLDVLEIVEYILTDLYNFDADINDDGILNVQDIIIIVDIIINL